MIITRAGRQYDSGRKESLDSHLSTAHAKPEPKKLSATRGRDTAYKRGGEARRLQSWGCKFRILVSLVLGKTPSYLAVKVSFRVAREKI